MGDTVAMHAKKVSPEGLRPRLRVEVQRDRSSMRSLVRRADRVGSLWNGSLTLARLQRRIVPARASATITGRRLLTIMREFAG